MSCPAPSGAFALDGALEGSGAGPEHEVVEEHAGAMKKKPLKGSIKSLHFATSGNPEGLEKMNLNLNGPVLKKKCGILPRVLGL